MNDVNWLALLKSCGIAFVTGFLGVFIAGLAGIFAVPEWNAMKAALIALSMASLIAGLNAIRAIWTRTMPADHEVS